MKKLLICVALIAVMIFGVTAVQASEASEVLWSNNNPNSVHNETKDYYVILEIDAECVVTSIMTYHYFNNGALPGTITLFAESGEQWGPFQAEGVDGQGDVKNAYWIADVDEIRLSPGRYAIVDSDQSTWSSNEMSEYYGIAELRGYYAPLGNPFGTGTANQGDDAAAGATDSAGVDVTQAYAAEVISFQAGDPWTADDKANDPSAVLGVPDYDSDADTNYLCLGSYGSIILRFDCYITDGDGADIVVYEIGSGVEETKVEVSNDLSTWYDVGDAQGANSSVDINGFIPEGAVFNYVRITDRDGGSSEWPGADLDAVAVVYPMLISLDPDSSTGSDLQTLQQKAENGDAEAQYTLGYMYEYGEGVPQDCEQAALWYRKAAEQGHAYAQCNLGYLYETGEGVPQDYEQAVLWYRKAAEQGDPYAQCDLGYLYYYGEGVPQDYEQAVLWYRKAAEQGDMYAQYNLGSMYENGEGVNKDMDQAILWYRKAAGQGFEQAQTKLDSLDQ